MNIIREVRSRRRSTSASSVGGDSDLENGRPGSAWTTLSATATLRRVFLPRSAQHARQQTSSPMSTSATSGTLSSDVNPTATVTGKLPRSSSLGRAACSNRSKATTTSGADHQQQQPVFGRTQLSHPQSTAGCWNNDRTSVASFAAGAGSGVGGPAVRHREVPLPTARGRPRPVSADVSRLNLGSFYRQPQHHPNTSSQQRRGMSTSNSEFFRVRNHHGGVSNHSLVSSKTEDESTLSCDTGSTIGGAGPVIESTPAKPTRDQSLESLLDEESSKVISNMTTSNTEASISTLNSVDCPSVTDDNDGEDRLTPTPSDGRENKNNNLRWNNHQSSLRVKAQEIRSQLDLLKESSGGVSPSLVLEAGTRPSSLLPPPPQPQPANGRTQHPNTPAQGFEHTLPPNLVNDNNNKNTTTEVFFPLFPTNNYSDIFGLPAQKQMNTSKCDNLLSSCRQKEQILQLQQSLLQQSNPNLVTPDETGSSASPVSADQSGSPSPSFVAVPFRLPLSVAAHMGAGGGSGGSLSTSPSTLSPCSSNSLSSNNFPHSASSQQLYQHHPHQSHRTSHNDNHHPKNNHKIPSSRSVHAFPASSGKSNKTTAGSSSDKLFFFFDVIMTQEKIAKVLLNSIKDKT